MYKNASGQILITACRIGRIMLESGAGINQVEQTIQYFCKSYEIISYDCSATPTEIIVSILDFSGRPHTLMQRIRYRNLNFNLIIEINSLCRNLQVNPLPIEETIAILNTIIEKKTNNLFLVVLASGIGTGAFAYILGKNTQDVLCCIVIGIILRLLIRYFTYLKIPETFSYLVSGAMVALLSWFTVFFGFGVQQDIITIAALSILFPGLIFTNSLRDIASGDLVSGISRAAEALWIAAALAGGAAFIYSILPQIGRLIT